MPEMPGHVGPYRPKAVRWPLLRQIAVDTFAIRLLADGWLQAATNTDYTCVIVRLDENTLHCTHDLFWLCWLERLSTVGLDWRVYVTSFVIQDLDSI
jgi:hypothetical protein